MKYTEGTAKDCLRIKFAEFSLSSYSVLAALDDRSLHTVALQHLLTADLAHRARSAMLSEPEMGACAASSPLQERVGLDIRTDGAGSPGQGAQLQADRAHGALGHCSQDMGFGFWWWLCGARSWTQ